MAPSSMRTVEKEVPTFVPPMALTSVDALPDHGEWLFEVKWDGYRCQALKRGKKVQLFSRNGHDFTTRFAQMARHIAELRCESALIDGEIVALDDQGLPCFQALQNGAQQHYLCFYAFDL